MECGSWYDPRSILTDVRFGPSNWLQIVYDASGLPLRLEDSGGQSLLVARLPAPPDRLSLSQAVATTVSARLRALASTVQDPGFATNLLPIAAARAQVPPSPAVPAAILEGMSLVRTQQAASALEQGMAPAGRNCCSASTQATALQTYLSRVTAPVALMSLAAAQVPQVIGDDILMLKSAYKLRKNMCAAGVAEPPGCHHGHHIVAVAHWKAAPARAILAAAGIDINEAVNGMFVACDQHGRLHTYAYYDKVEAELKLAVPLNRTTVTAKLNRIRLAIATGTF